MTVSFHNVTSQITSSWQNNRSPNLELKWDPFITKVTLDLLLEMNPDVKGQAIVASVETFCEKQSQYFQSASFIVMSQKNKVVWVYTNRKSRDWLSTAAWRQTQPIFHLTHMGSSVSRIFGPLSFQWLNQSLLMYKRMTFVSVLCSLPLQSMFNPSSLMTWKWVTHSTNMSHSQWFCSTNLRNGKNPMMGKFLRVSRKSRPSKHRSKHLQEISVRSLIIKKQSNTPTYFSNPHNLLLLLCKHSKHLRMLETWRRILNSGHW